MRMEIGRGVRCLGLHTEGNQDTEREKHWLKVTQLVRCGVRIHTPIRGTPGCQNICPSSSQSLPQKGLLLTDMLQLLGWAGQLL